MCARTHRNRETALHPQNAMLCSYFPYNYVNDSNEENNYMKPEVSKFRQRITELI